MARRFLAALALAQGASALLDDGFVDVLVNVEHRLPADAFAGVVHAAGGSNDDGYEACVVANDVLESCYDAGYMEPTAAVDDADRCLCCVGTTPISKVYSSCASYASNEVPRATADYTALSNMYVYCAAMATCATATRQGGATTRPTTRPTAAVTLPAACASMTDIYNSCSLELGFETAKATDVASCFCPSSAGGRNTKFEDYASSCAPFARTAFPRDYEVITHLATFCDDYASRTSAPALVFTTAGTRTGHGFALPSVTSSATSTATRGAAGSIETTSSSTGLATPGLAVPGVLASFANIASFVLSFFFLI